MNDRLIQYDEGQIGPAAEKLRSNKFIRSQVAQPNTLFETIHNRLA